MKHMTERCETVVKKWVFRGKKRVIGIEKIRGGDQSRKAKWCKMQVLFFKTDKMQGMKDKNSGYLPVFQPIFSLERSEN